MFDDFDQIETFKKLKYSLNTFSINYLKTTFFEKKNLIDGHVVYEFQKNKYNPDNQTDKLYKQVRAYIYHAGKKYFISKSNAKPNSQYLGEEELKILKKKIEMRDEARLIMKSYKTLAKMYYNQLCWSNKNFAKCFDFDLLIKATCHEIEESDLYHQIIDSIDKYLEGELLAEIYQKKASKRGKFYNSIFSDAAERIRSKNEMIVLNCLKKCGLNYRIEPSYPNSNTKADFSILNAYPYATKKESSFHICNEIFIEIAGMRNSEKYEKELTKKIKEADHYSVPLVIIDMTDNYDEENIAQSKINETNLQHILLKIYLGDIQSNGNIIEPYSA